MVDLTLEQLKALGLKLPSNAVEVRVWPTLVGGEGALFVKVEYWVPVEAS